MSASVVVQGRLQRGAPPVEIAIAGGRIDAIRPAGSGGASAVGGADCLVTEGFLDIQVNGFAAVDFNRPDLTAEDLVRATRAMWRTGVTQFLPTVVTAPVQSMLGTLRAIARAREQEPILRRAIPGIHLEGPFLAPEDGPRGAHPADSIRDPDWGLFRQFQDAAGGLIRLVTIAPERPGAIGVIWQLRQAGIAVGIGHSDAKEADIDQAVEAGAQISCHLGNGAHAMLPRHRNYIQKQFATDALMASLITDGHHLPSYVVKNMIRCKGVDRDHPHHGRHGRRRRAAREVSAGRGAGRGRFGRLRSPPRHSLSRRFGAHHGSGHRERGQIRRSPAGGCAAAGQPATADALPRPGERDGARGAGRSGGLAGRAAAHRRGDDRRRGGRVPAELSVSRGPIERRTGDPGVRCPCRIPLSRRASSWISSRNITRPSRPCSRRSLDTQKEAIRTAARRCADAIAEDRYLYVIGTGGHSYIASEEMFWRAGGLVPIYPILDPGLSLSQGAWRSNLIERTPGYVIPILKYHGVGERGRPDRLQRVRAQCGDHRRGQEGKRLGATVIGVTSTEFAARTPADHPSRHPSGKNLHEIVDIFLNTCLPYGDAVVDVPGCPQKVAPSSSLGTAFVLNSLVATTVEELVRRGIDPPVWMSANLPGGDEANRKHFDKHLRRVKFL